MRTSSATGRGGESTAPASPRTSHAMQMDHSAIASTNAIVDLGPRASAILKMRVNLFTLNSN
jgi:hypothetical protein